VSLTLGNDTVGLLKLLKFIIKMTLNYHCRTKFIISIKSIIIDAMELALLGATILLAVGSMSALKHLGCPRAYWLWLWALPKLKDTANSRRRAAI